MYIKLRARSDLPGGGREAEMGEMGRGRGEGRERERGVSLSLSLSLSLPG